MLFPPNRLSVSSHQGGMLLMKEEIFFPSSVHWLKMKHFSVIDLFGILKPTAMFGVYGRNDLEPSWGSLVRNGSTASGRLSESKSLQSPLFWMKSKTKLRQNLGSWSSTLSQRSSINSINTKTSYINGLDVQVSAFCNLQSLERTVSLSLQYHTISCDRLGQSLVYQLIWVSTQGLLVVIFLPSSLESIRCLIPSSYNSPRLLSSCLEIWWTEASVINWKLLLGSGPPAEHPSLPLPEWSSGTQAGAPRFTHRAWDGKSGVGGPPPNGPRTSAGEFK